MSKPLRHAISSARQFGGTPEDFLPIHDFMDSSKGAFADNRHRVLTHQSWFIAPQGPLERSFGTEMLVPRTDSLDGFLDCQGQINHLEYKIQQLRYSQRKYAHVIAIRDIGEQHILEDFQGKFIPNPSDYLNDMVFHPWIDNGNKGLPPSAEGLAKSVKTTIVTITD